MASKFLTSDQGSAYKFSVLRKVNRLIGVEQRFTTSYHPQSNALVERMMKFLTEKMTAYINQKQDNRAEITSFLVHAYNMTRHTTTETEPRYLLFGVKPNLPIDTIFQNCVKSEQKCERTIKSYIQNLIIKWRNALDFAEILTQKAHEKNAKKYNANRLKDFFEIGDCVLIRDLSRQVGRTEKLKNIFKGPYKVTAIQDGGVNFVLESLSNKPSTDKPVVHLSRLKRWHEDELGLTENR